MQFWVEWQYYGPSYTGSTHALGACRLGSIPSSPINSLERSLLFFHFIFLILIYMSNRKVADCRLHPSVNNCSLTIVGTGEEVLKAAVEHAVSSHGHEDTPELRDGIRAMLKDE